MTKPTITRQFALDLLKSIVEDKGADTVVSCEYTNEDEVRRGLEEELAPVCIVGHALSRIGVPIEEIAKLEGDTADNVVPELEHQGYFNITRDALELLQYAQTAQDNQHNWGDAVWAAERGVSLSREVTRAQAALRLGDTDRGAYWDEVEADEFGGENS